MDEEGVFCLVSPIHPPPSPFSVAGGGVTICHRGEGLEENGNSIIVSEGYFRPDGEGGVENHVTW